MPTAAKPRSEKALSRLSFLLADVQNGMGPYITVFLKASAHWNPARIGIAMAAANVTQVLAQTPAGALLDRLRRKRELIALGAFIVAASCLAMAWRSSFPVVLTAQSCMGIAGAIFPAGVAALSLGIVGRARLDARMGRNQAYNAAGNVVAAVVIGGLGFLGGRTAMFYLIAALSVAAAITVLSIRPGDVDDALARGADDGAQPDRAGKGAHPVAKLFADRRLVVLLAATVLFHCANAAMLPLVTQLLSSGAHADRGALYTSTYVVTSQLVWIAAAAGAGHFARTRGRKPTFLVAFAVLPLRGFLYTLSDRPAALIAVQTLDGIGAGIFGVVSVLMIADLTRGTGRFNSAQGAISAAQGSGAFVSNLMTGAIVKRCGFHAGFYTLTAIALVALVFFATVMPETQEGREQAECADDPANRAEPVAPLT
jgi:MFS family permease